MSMRLQSRPAARPTQRRWALALASLVALATPLAAVGPADAALYSIAQCEQGDSAVELTPGFVSGIRTAVLNDCGGAGVGFNLGNVGNVVSPDGEVDDQAGFLLSVPAALPNTKITKLSSVLTLSAKTESAEGGGGGLSSYSAENVRWGQQRYISRFAEPAVSKFLWERSDPTGTRGLRTVLECSRPCQFTTRPALVLHRATITLDDPVPPVDPTVEPVGLFGGGPQRGTRIVRINASDGDSGVRTVELRTDGGATVLGRAADGADCSYTRPAPCPQSRTQLDIAVDTTTLPRGGNVFELWTTDAAGNLRKTLLPAIIVDNTPPGTQTPGPGVFPTPTPDATPAAPNGSGGDPLTGAFVAKATVKRLATTFGKPFKVAGQLVDAAGRPVVGAGVDVTERIAVAGATARPVTTITTDAAGRFTYAGRGASNRTVEFAFAQRIGSTTYASKVAVEVRVKAAVSLRASRSTVRTREKARFTGRVQIADFPAKGARVVLEANTGAGWKLGAFVRTRPDGTFTWTHAFRNRARFQIRARLLTSPDLPAVAAISRPTVLKVR